MKHILWRIGGLMAGLMSCVAFAAPAGSLDPTFGAGGTQMIGFEAGGNKNDWVEAMVAGPGGTLYLIGHIEIEPNQNGIQTAIGLARFTHDGLMDESFGPKGRRLHDEAAYEKVWVHDAAVQDDGRIVVVGEHAVTQPASRQMIACRFEISGTVDSSFGNPQTPGCIAIPSPVGTLANAHGVVVQSNGRIVLAGQAYDNDASMYRAAVVRLLPNGLPDASFGNQGGLAPGYRILFPDFDTDSTSLQDIANASDGSLVVTGSHDLNGNNADFDVLVARLKGADGTLDETFDGTGWRLVALDEGGAWNDHGAAVAALPDGSVLVAGGAQLDGDREVPFLVKLDSAGAGYPGFGTSGVQLYSACEFPCAMRADDIQVTGSGDIFLGGAFKFLGFDGDDFFVLRLHSDGERDFGPNVGVLDGFAFVNMASGNDWAYRILLQGERVLAAGVGETSSNSGNFDFAIARLDHGIEEQFTVTPISGPGGSMLPDTPQIVGHSDQVDFVVTADEGFSIVQVTGCGGSLFEGVYTTAPVTEDCTVMAEFSPDLVLEYSAGAHGSIDGPALQIVPYGDSGKPVEAIADTGYHFVQWDDGVLDNPRQDEDVIQDISVSALFDINLHEVAPNPGPGGALSPDVAQWVPHGGSTQFVVQPDPGFAIGEISGCAGMLQGNVFTTVAILEGCKVSVTFVANNEMFSLQYLVQGNGILTGDTQQSVLSGADGTPVTAVPDPGFVFVGWSDGGNDNPRQDTHVVADIEVTAIFVADQLFNVTPSAGQGGSISPDLVQSVGAGENVVFTLTPDPGSVIKDVSGTCGGSLVGNTFTTAPITSNCNVVANFQTEQEAADAIFSDGFED